MKLVLDAEYLLAEVTEAAEYHDLTEDQIKYIESLSPGDIEFALHSNISDDVLDVLDDVRRNAIADLARQADEHNKE